MDDFSVKPGVPNAFGLIGDDANAIEAGKRPLSSMTPSFLLGHDKVAVIGTPGGSRIITMVLLGMLELMDGGSAQRSEEHTSELQSLMRISYAVFCLKKKN